MTPRTRALLDYIHAPNQRAATDVIIDAAKAGTFNDDQPRLDGPSDAAVFAAYDYLIAHRAKTDTEGGR